MVTPIVFAASFIVPTTPFSEKAVIAFADDAGSGIGSLSPPLLQPALSIIKTEANNINNFFIAFSLFYFILLKTTICHGITASISTPARRRTIAPVANFYSARSQAFFQRPLSLRVLLIILKFLHPSMLLSKLTMGFRRSYGSELLRTILSIIEMSNSMP